MTGSGTSQISLSPQQTLLDYFAALLELNHYALAEAEAAKQAGREMDLEDLRAKRVAIRARFCTNRKRKTDNVVSYGILEARAYDPSNLVIEREAQDSPDRAEVTIHNTALHERLKYILVMQKGTWRIDSLQFRDGRKWIPVPLH
jgi:hypothetical protein